MPQTMGQRLMISTPHPCHHQGELSLRWLKGCNQSHKGLRLKNSLTLQEQRVFHHDTAQWHCLPNSLPPLWDWRSNYLAGRWMPATTLGHSQNKCHPLHIRTQTNGLRLPLGNVMSQQGRAEVCTGVVIGVAEARADLDKRKFSSPLDMNPLTVKNTRGRKSSAGARHLNGTWRSMQLRSRKCSHTVAATSLNVLMRSGVPFDPWTR